MTNIKECFARACKSLDLEVDPYHVVELEPGKSISSEVYIPNLGGPRGMLIFRSFQDMQGFDDELIEAGYGYSVMSEPTTEEEYSPQSLIEVFLDWGWSGDEGSKPAWMSDQEP